MSGGEIVSLVAALAPPVIELIGGAIRYAGASAEERERIRQEALDAFAEVHGKMEAFWARCDDRLEAARKAADALPDGP